MLLIYTDGAMCRGNGASAFIALELQDEVPGKTLILVGDKKYTLAKEHRSGYYYTNTSNNRVETLAFLRGLEYFRDHCASTCVFMTDSRYVQTGWSNAAKWKTQGWRNTGGPVKNLDLWQYFLKLHSTVGKDYDVKWVRGHNGDYWNEQVDQYASLIAKRGS